MWNISDSTKHNLKAVGGYLALIVTAGILMASPEFYLWITSGARNGKQAICGTERVDARKVELREALGSPDYWNFQPVAVSGKLLYARDRETFYLRDGVFSLPLNVSDCQNLEGFENDETLAAVKGTLSGDANDLFLTVTDMRETVPGFFKIVHGAGSIGLIALLVVPLILGILRAFLWVFSLIGLRKKEVIASPEDAGNRAAGRMLLASIGIPFVWLMNPLLGAGLHIFNVFHNRGGLKSPKRNVAFAGATLSVIGFVGMLVSAISIGAFVNPEKGLNMYATVENNIHAAPTGKELVELYPYINNDLYFSIHQPKGWVADETKIKTEALLTFEGPEDGMFQEKPFRPEFNVSFSPITAFGVKNNADALQTFRALMQKNAESPLIVDENHTLGAGRLDALLVETTETREKGYKRHILALVVAENEILYIAGVAIPEEKWSERYAQATRAAFRTFDAWRATFAACLKANGAILYSAFNCPYCETQKELFTEGIERLPYAECARGVDDTAQTDACNDKNITGYPTWEFADGTRLIGQQPLKTLSEKAKCALPR